MTFYQGHFLHSLVVSFSCMYLRVYQIKVITKYRTTRKLPKNRNQRPPSFKINNQNYSNYKHCFDLVQVFQNKWWLSKVLLLVDGWVIIYYLSIICVFNNHRSTLTIQWVELWCGVPVSSLWPRISPLVTLLYVGVGNLLFIRD